MHRNTNTPIRNTLHSRNRQTLPPQLNLHTDHDIHLRSTVARPMHRHANTSLFYTTNHTASRHILRGWRRQAVFA
jgi:hypothetical protein